ncbi:MAG: glycoside hydrolase family 125 protein [Clostridia bacterium]|jgi:meiotically up-regulated gene 157 (Mug157) protein|nr:glycoside hydrolase family 125 protein [Clostridia bacterium]MBQ6003733.1 glycoside hydrolase family 125 protein [Clostridia bacterium]MBR0438415.1 glycoside hydrolase family 125 protein [Clostridia bacterium]MBR6135809.1 glycoside hydrolase family 125 protein [Clostridia bacterium]
MEKIPQILLDKAEELEQYYARVFPGLAPLAGRCFLNTVETTVKKTERGYFVITGDIPAMWLRDSSAQVSPYIRYAVEDMELREMLEGIIEKQAELVIRDPYANAFMESDEDVSIWVTDSTEMRKGVWERKYEVDSLCAPVYLAWKYWKETGREDIFNDKWKAMALEILRVFRMEQHHEKSEYSFERFGFPETDTLPCKGRGNPVGYTGMVWSGFRPSDDRCIYGYLIPSNMMATVAMSRLEEILEKVYRDSRTAREAKTLADEIEEGIRRFGIVEDPDFGKVFAYETDGLGNYVMMDDANSPSLLSVPYIGYRSPDDELYVNTRKLILSEKNPFFYTGKYAKGMGSPHTKKGYVWHIGLIMQAMTSNDRDEIREMLSMIAATHAGTNYMHESFDPDDPSNFSREWFAWANTFFAELLTELKERRILEEP